MSEKIKNIITVILWILLVGFLCGYIVLAWELRATKESVDAFNNVVEWIKSIDQKIADNSAKYVEAEEQKKSLAEYQKQLHSENEQLRQDRETAQNSFLEWLWLIESSQAQ